MDKPRAIELAPGERLLPLKEAAARLGAPSAAALLMRIRRSANPAIQYGAVKLGGKWHILIQEGKNCMRTRLAALSIIAALALTGCSGADEPSDHSASTAAPPTTQQSDAGTTGEPTQEKTTEAAPEPPRDVNIAALAPGTNTWS